MDRWGKVGFCLRASMVVRLCVAWFEFSRTWVIGIKAVDGVVGSMPVLISARAEQYACFDPCQNAGRDVLCLLKNVEIALKKVLRLNVFRRCSSRKSFRAA